MRKIIELLLNRPSTLRQSFTAFLSHGGDAACVVGAAYLAAGHTYEEFRRAIEEGGYSWVGEYVQDMLVAAGVDPNEEVLLPVSPEGYRVALPLFDALYRMNDSLMMSFDRIIDYLSDEENWRHDKTKWALSASCRIRQLQG